MHERPDPPGTPGRYRPRSQPLPVFVLALSAGADRFHFCTSDLLMSVPHRDTVFAPLAQVAEQLTLNQRVRGSSP